MLEGHVLVPREKEVYRVFRNYVLPCITTNNTIQVPGTIVTRAGIQDRDVYVTLDKEDAWGLLETLAGFLGIDLEVKDK